MGITSVRLFIGLHLQCMTGEQEMLPNSNGSHSIRKQFPAGQTSNNHIPKEDPTVTSSCLEEILPERDQPVEEPWLLRSTLSSMVEPKNLDVTTEQNKSHQIESPGNLCSDTEMSIPEESQLSYAEKSASIVILINSSICTMQRIAILEDGKLVELLLEPVKNNVQCDSIYLGVVTKFVPHMGGAFVDIGISRPSLMDIKQNREPFVFPLFQQEIGREYVNGFFNAEKSKLTNMNENEQCLDDEDCIDNVLEVDPEVAYSREDFEDPETDDEIDVTDVPQNTSFASEFVSNEYYSEDSEVNESHLQDDVENYLILAAEDSNFLHPIRTSTKWDNSISADNKWANVRKGTKVIVQVVKEGLGTKGPALSAYPKLKSRFWVLTTRCDRIGVSKKITGLERARLRAIARTLQPLGFGLTLRTVAAGHSLEELQKDLDGLLTTWKCIIEHAKSAALAAEEGVEGAIPVMLHKAMGQTLSVVQDYFNEKVGSMVVDSPRTYHEVTSYLREVAPDLCQRVWLYDKRTPIFDEYDIEEEINNILSKRIPLLNGGSLVIEQTEALVSIDVNGGHGMLGQGTSQEKAVLEVNLAAARQIARELRLRDIGGIIVVDFIDMANESNKRLVYEEMKKAVERDHSMVKVSELSKHGLMEITRKRVRPSVTFMISEPCSCCHATGRVEAIETTFSKIEHEICRLIADMDHKPDPENVKSWPQFVLRVDRFMCNYLTSGKRTKLAVLSSALKVWILLKVARGFSRGTFEVKPFTEEKENDGQRVAISRLRHTEATSYIIPNSKLTLFPMKKWRGRIKR
ncbi:ribonuclease E/G-like protein, chloroplastic isoform X2 [Phalaenopsis equestris]|uniref:ribonuclease E/G-like protein, chloroplastic isoform X2 n=1 Tax=Phalaenopsis equestris TaxID=78828 RepID=UPI0009E38B11|nr:ribonuclease E/G-like protein, chloroplastic isoform X2 [Phalaenopsis equestris]